MMLRAPPTTHSCRARAAATRARQVAPALPSSPATAAVTASIPAASRSSCCTPGAPLHSAAARRATNRRSTATAARAAPAFVDQPADSADAAVRPDLELVHPAGARVAVFGVEHLERQPHIGEWILAQRPAAVVVETAATPEHGAAPGRRVTCRDQVQGAAGMFLRVFCQVAAALQEQGQAARAPGGVWQQAASQFNGEQLAYVAALAAGSQLLFGDRPKQLTYRRLFSVPNVAELDDAFGAEVAAAYAANLLAMRQAAAEAGRPAQLPGGASLEALRAQAAQHEAALASSCVWRVMMREREAVMLGVVDQAARGLLAAPGAAQPWVALVVGSAHLPGLQQLWGNGEWQQLLGAQPLADSPLLQAPPLSRDDMSQPGAGVKRGLLEAVLSLSMPQEVLDDVQDSLPPMPEGPEAEARQWAYEAYTSFSQRMHLAALPPELLDQVCSAVAGSSADAVLEPLRQLRPVNGGPGWCPELGMQLRALNFDIRNNTAGEA